jgi:hypothetical protein
VYIILKYKTMKKLYPKGVFGSEVFSQFWKNTTVFSNIVVLYT